MQGPPHLLFSGPWLGLHNPKAKDREGRCGEAPPRSVGCRKPPGLKAGEGRALPTPGIH